MEKKEAHQSESVSHRKLQKVKAISAPVQDKQTQDQEESVYPTQCVCHRN